MIDILEPKLVEKPWGHELIVAHTERYIGKILHIYAGHALSRQYHNVKDETLYVLNGELILEIGAGEEMTRVTVQTGRCFRLKPKTIHRFIAPCDVDLIEVSTPELQDVVRLEDLYGREGTHEP